MVKSSISDAYDVNLPVIAAVNLEWDCLPFVKSIASLCQKIQTSLELVYVKPGADAINIYYLTGGVYYGEKSQLPSIPSMPEDEAQEKFERLISAIDFDIPINYRILEGDIVGEVLHHASQRKSFLTVIGISDDKHIHPPIFFSKTLKFMAKSERPVMLIPDSRFIDFSSDYQRIIIADDLMTSDNAVQYGMRLGVLLGKSRIMHANVHDEDVDLINIYQPPLLVANYSYVKPEMTYKYILGHDKKVALQKLENQTTHIADKLRKSGGYYESTIVWGKVKEELERLTGDFNPDIIVYGGSHPSILKHFHYKKMSNRKKIRQNKIIIIAPQ